MKYINKNLTIEKVNVQKIASLIDLFNKPVSEITFNIKSIKDIHQISNLVKTLKNLK